MKKTALLLTCLTVALCLVACGGKEKTTTSSSTTKTTKTSASKASKATTETKSEESNVSTTSQKEEMQSTPSTSTEAQSEQTQTSTTATASSSIDTDVLVRGDYSSLVGTWMNGYGDSLTFDANGLVSDTQFLSSQPGRVYNNDGIYRTGIGFKSGGGAALFVLPAGVRFSPEETADGVDVSDSNRDRIYIGQSVLGDSNQVFYRQ